MPALFRRNPRGLCFLFLWIVLKAVVVRGEDTGSDNLDDTVEIRKRLVLFAGPHKAASRSVQDFFYNHASGATGTNIAGGLDGWLWPNIPDKTVWADEATPLDPSEAFDALVTQADNTTAHIILTKHIQAAWEKSKYGIILGTPEFDRAGKALFADKPRAAIQAMKMVQNVLRIGPEDVTVVLNYRVPRLDQWLSLWKKENEADDSQHYRKFLCKGSAEEQMEFIDTAMNPLKVAKLYRKQAWEVFMIDMKGVEEAGHDVAHVLACQVLENTRCQDGFVVPLSTTYRSNYGGDHMLNWQGTDMEENLEHLFEERDCNFQDDLEKDHGFDILYRRSVWRHCKNDDESRESYAALTDPQVVLDSLRTQKGCSKSKVAVDSLLVGDYDGDDVIQDNAGAYDIEALEEEDEVAEFSDETKGRSAFFTVTFFVVSFGFGIYQLQFIKRMRSNNNNELQMQSLSISGTSTGKYSDTRSDTDGEDGFDDFMTWTQEYRDEE